MNQKDYSYLVTNITPKEDERPFWLRLLSSIRASVSPCSKKVSSTSDEVKRGLSIKISGGADF